MNNWIIQDFIRTGRSHAARQLPCQDALKYVNSPELALVVVADGVGSLSNSHIAAKAAAEGAVEWFRNNLKTLMNPANAENSIRSRLLPTLQKYITNRAKEHGVLLESVDCNFAFICILPTADYAIWGVLGDGAVCVLRKDRCHVLSGADSLSANGTDTIMQQENADALRTQMVSLSDGKTLGFMIMSDGLENEIYQKNSTILRYNAASYFNAMLLPSEQERKAAVSELLAELPDTFDDDISLGILSNARRNAPLVLDPDPTWLCTCGRRNALDSSTCSCQMSFRQLYGELDFGPDPALYFLGLNREPARERSILGLPEEVGGQSPPTKPIRGQRSEGVRLSPGQQIKQEKDTKSTKSSPGSTTVPKPSRTNNPSERNTTTPSGSFAGRSTEGTHPRTDGGSTKPHNGGSTQNAPAEIIEFRFRDFIPILSLVLSVIAIAMSTVSILWCASVSRKLEQGMGEQVVQESAGDLYIVEGGYLNVWEYDGEKLQKRVARLESGSILERLSDEEILIDDLVYVNVRTETGAEGWSNLASLVPLDPDTAP